MSLTFYLSVIFDTIDHNILLSRLSLWFEITGTVLDWFKSYQSSRPFRVKCESSFSSFQICFVASRKYLFSAPGFYHVGLYTTPLSSLISSLSHTMIRNFSFPFILQMCIRAKHPHDAMQQFWMTSNLLTLNSSKTEFSSLDSKSNSKLPNCRISV